LPNRQRDERLKTLAVLSPVHWENPTVLAMQIGRSCVLALRTPAFGHASRDRSRGPARGPQLLMRGKPTAENGMNVAKVFVEAAIPGEHPGRHRNRRLLYNKFR